MGSLVINDLWGNAKSTVVNGLIVLPKIYSEKIGKESIVICPGLNNTISIYPKKNFVDKIEALSASVDVKKRKLATIMIRYAQDQELKGNACRFRVPKDLLNTIIDPELTVAFGGCSEYIRVFSTADYNAKIKEDLDFLFDNFEEGDDDYKHL